MEIFTRSTKNPFYKLNTKKNQFEADSFQFTAVANNTRYIIEDNDNTWWIASATGLFHVDMQKDFLMKKNLKQLTIIILRQISCIRC